MSLVDVIVAAALAAGEEIEAIYGAGCATSYKGDGSPVTIADEQAERIILAHLRDAYPEVPVLAEEEACAGRIPALGGRFFLVDPLDGTKGFVARNGEFTVNIALIEDGTPVAGVVYAPDSRMLYFGAQGKGAFRRLAGAEAEPIRVRPRPAAGLTAVGSRNHHAHGTEERVAALGVTDFVPSGSSLKFCMVAEGSADVYPRYGRTMEWDTGAGQAVLEAAGGRVMALAGGVEAGMLRYGKADQQFENPHFIAWGA
jgi:3'(2'), 5'-bisphosphate nucleotidase